MNHEEQPTIVDIGRQQTQIISDDAFESESKTISISNDNQSASNEPTFHLASELLDPKLERTGPAVFIPPRKRERSTSVTTSGKLTSAAEQHPQSVSGTEMSDVFMPIYHSDGTFNFGNPDAILASARPLFQGLRSGKIADPIIAFPEVGPMGGPVRLRISEVRWALEERTVIGKGSKPRVIYDLLSMGSTSVSDRKGGDLVDKLWIPPRRKIERGEHVTK